MAEESKELTEAPKTGLLALPDADQIREILSENLGGLQAAFEVVKIPTGGMTAWSVPSEDGEPEIAKELIGVILHHYSVRAYWETKYGGEGAGAPPTCSSLDAKRGTLPRNDDGEFGDCATCKWSKFGTATKQDGKPGRGQACGLKHRVFLLMPERSLFPIMIPLSTMSSTKNYEGSISTYGVKMAGKGKKLTHVKSKVKLIKDKNADGIEYAKAQFFFVGDLSPEEKERIDVLRESLISAMKNKPIDNQEIVEEKDPWENGIDG